MNEALVDGDRVVLFCTRRGTHEGAFEGFAPRGRSFEISVVHRFRIADGRVVERWRLADALGMARQPGLLPDSPRTGVSLLLGRIRGRFAR